VKTPPDTDIEPILSIVIPAHNEERRLPATLDRIVSHLSGASFPWEIIVIDDGSRDRTAEIVRSAHPDVRLSSNPLRLGKGSAIRKGVFEARGRYIVFMDADLSVPLVHLEPMLAILRQGVPVVIGSRRAPGSKIVVHQPLIREKLGQFFNIVIRLLGLSSFHDTQCGFKGFHRETARRIFSLQKTGRFAFDVEVLHIAAHHGFEIRELPVQWFNSRETKVIPLLDPFLMLVDIIRIRLQSWQGKYRPLQK
jgi:dolichyl-phosphate beta-glucosyltransferase